MSRDWDNPDTTTVDIRAAFKKRRMSMGYSLNDLAERLRVSKQAVNNWEQGTHKPSERHLEDACTILRLDFVEFCEAWRGNDDERS